MGAPTRAAFAVAALAVLALGLAVALGGALRRVARLAAALVDVRGPRARVGLRPRTGDLVLCVGAACPSTAAVLAGTFFSHAGVVVCPPGGGAFLSEATPAAVLAHGGLGGGAGPRPGAPRLLRSGADLAPLDVRAGAYLGRCYLAALEPPLPRRRAARLEAEARRLCGGAPYPPLACLALSALCGRRVGPRHCFQHVAHLLAVAGLLPAAAGDAGPLAACRAVCALPGRRLPGGFAYAAPLLLGPGALVPDADPRAPRPAGKTAPASGGASAGADGPTRAAGGNTSGGASAGADRAAADAGDGSPGPAAKAAPSA